jgi:hypothetical protein
LAASRKKKPRKLSPPYYYILAQRITKAQRWYDPVVVVSYKIYSLQDTLDGAMKEFILCGVFETEFCQFKMYKVDMGGRRTKVADISNS